MVVRALEELRPDERPPWRLDCPEFPRDLLLPPLNPDLPELERPELRDDPR